MLPLQSWFQPLWCHDIYPVHCTPCVMWQSEMSFENILWLFIYQSPEVHLKSILKSSGATEICLLCFGGLLVHVKQFSLNKWCFSWWFHCAMLAVLVTQTGWTLLQDEESCRDLSYQGPKSCFGAQVVIFTSKHRFWNAQVTLLWKVPFSTVGGN